MKDIVPYLTLGILTAIHRVLLSMAIPVLSRYYLENARAVFTVVVAISISTMSVILQLHHIKRNLHDIRGLAVVATIGQWIATIASSIVIIKLFFC